MDDDSCRLRGRPGQAASGTTGIGTSIGGLAFLGLCTPPITDSTQQWPWPISLAMLLRREYLSQKLDRPLPTKDGGTLRTIGEACDYMTAIGKKRELRTHWQRVLN
jgi:hypothetical protein